ncbi:MAG: flippase [Calditrichia bacterium]
MNRTQNFKSDVLSTFGTQVLILVLALATNILIARLLGATNLGIFAFISLLGTVLVRFNTLGIEVSNVYYLGQQTYSREDIKSNTLLFWMGAAAAGIVVLFGLQSTNVIKRFSEIDPKWLKWTYPIFLFFLFEEFHLTYFLGQQKIKQYNFLRLIRPGLVLIFIGGMMIFRFNSLQDIFIAYTAGLALYNIILFIWVKPVLHKPNFELMKATFRYGLQAYMANISSFLNYRLDMFLVIYFLTPADLGFYSVSVLIAEKLWYLASASSTVLFPRVASSVKRNGELTSKTCRINLSVILVAALFLGLSSHFLIRFFYTESFLPAADALIALLPGIVTYSIPKVLSAELSGRGKPHYAMISSLLTLLLNVVLNIILIPRYGIVGAALASSLSYSAAAGLFLWFYKRETGISLKDVLFIKRSDFLTLRGLL